jgi:sialidase-1
VSKLIHEGPSGYSSLARLKDGSVGCLYERGHKDNYREMVTFARFPLSWL